jgi:hypothetical protein
MASSAQEVQGQPKRLIGKLPVELLAFVFLIIVDDEIAEYLEAVEDGSFFMVDSPLILSWVSRFWRLAAHTTPALWTFAQINIASKSQDRLLHFIHLWGGLAGTVIAENVSFYGSSNRYTMMYSLPQAQIKEFIYRERQSERSLSWAPVVFPTARKVVVHLNERGNGNIRHGEWTRSFHKDANTDVESIELYNCDLSRLPESLEEFKWSVKTHISPRQLSSVLLLPNLRKLHLCHMTFTVATMVGIPSMNPVQNLTHLILENISCQAFRLLNSKSLPSLKRLGLYDFAFADDSLADFIAELSPALEQLDIIGPPPMLLDAWKTLLGVATGVTEMVIGLRGDVQLNHSNSHFLEAMRDPLLLPKLAVVRTYSRNPYLTHCVMLEEVRKIRKAHGLA